MKNLRFVAIFGAVALALSLSACSTSPMEGTNNGATVEDATLAGSGDYAIQDDVLLGYDSNDGSLTVGDPNANGIDGYAGPQSLRGNNTVYFKYDSDQILDEYATLMQNHAQYLRDNPDAKIIIEGHTDERGTPEYNIALGERRARAVARYMQNLGVDVNQLSIVSYGEEKPIDPSHSENAWQKNRRAVINY